MLEILAGLFLLLLFVIWASNFFSLPGNWVNIVLLALWKWMQPEMPAGWWFFIALGALAGVAEIIEFVSQMYGARKYGGSNRGSWGALIGALAGAVLGAPFFLGLGSILGALAGAFIGSLIVELAYGRSWAEAIRASKGAMLGKVVGFVAKAALGMVMITWSIPKVWPG
ncbi:MAG: DUF456 domain-containing protein [Desulfovermiculus sp.]|nr:DUF456 domain-containing protein [Desulfovermiculus sp.]